MKCAQCDAELCHLEDTAVLTDVREQEKCSLLLPTPMMNYYNDFPYTPCTSK